MSSNGAEASDDRCNATFILGEQSVVTPEEAKSAVEAYGVFGVTARLLGGTERIRVDIHGLLDSLWDTAKNALEELGVKVIDTTNHDEGDPANIPDCTYFSPGEK